MRIGELARRSGASPRSIRHYEASGLLVSRRSANGYREFDEPSVERVERIRELVGQGLGVDDVRALLACYDAAAGRLRPCALAIRRYQETLLALERRIAALVAARDRAQAGLRALERR